MSKENDNDKMSSVSNCSKFSSKSQKVISNMRSMMLAAGLDPNAAFAAAGVDVELDMEVDPLTKKRRPSRSPETKNLTSSESDEEEEEEDEQDTSLKSKEEWMLARRGKKSKLPSKRELKRARRAERAKLGKLEALRTATFQKEKEKEKGGAPQKKQVQVTDQAQAQAESTYLAAHHSPGATKISSCDVPHSSPVKSGLFSEIVANFRGHTAPAALAVNPNCYREPLPPVFKTPAPEGPFRDEVVVEILTLNGTNYVGTVTPVEARSMIYQGALGLDQSNLASINIGFNRVRTVTFKLRQQIDLDDLYQREFFEIERRAGQEVHLITCKIRGVRNPANRLATTARPSGVPAPLDDGSRTIRIIGCEFRLSESEILSWLSCFGEVLSEITEEQFESEGLDPDLPPVGNGVYNVRMRLKMDLPNWLPMYGKKICVEYPGARRQCSGCYGYHARKFCRSEKCGMESFITGFSQKYPFVPVNLYGKLSHLAKSADQKSLKTNQVSDSDPALTQSKSQQNHHEHPDPASRSKNTSKPTD